MKTHLIISHGEYPTSHSLAAVLCHIAHYADETDALMFAEDDVFNATAQAIDSLSHIQASAQHIRGARHW